MFNIILVNKGIMDITIFDNYVIILTLQFSIRIIVILIGNDSGRLNKSIGVLIVASHPFTNIIFRK